MLFQAYLSTSINSVSLCDSHSLSDHIQTNAAYSTIASSRSRSAWICKFGCPRATEKVDKSDCSKCVEINFDVAVCFAIEALCSKTSRMLVKLPPTNWRRFAESVKSAAGPGRISAAAPPAEPGPGGVQAAGRRRRAPSPRLAPTRRVTGMRALECSLGPGQWASLSEPEPARHWPRHSGRLVPA